MVIAVIGLGSNLNRPLQQLRKAVAALASHSEIKITAYSSIYQSNPLLPEIDSDPDWKNKSFLNAAVKVETSLVPHALLHALKNIENRMDRKTGRKWAPRTIDLDILCYDNLVLDDENLILPHPGLLVRAFALVPLLEVLPDYTILPAYMCLKRLPHRLNGPEIVGVLNVTPDSCSDPGFYLEPEKALQHAQVLFAAGADIIDIGAESTRPSADLIDPVTEWRRLRPVLSLCQQFWAGQEHRPLISIDTRYARTVERAVEYEINWVNTVEQSQFEAMVPFLKEKSLRYVAMHHGIDITGTHKKLPGSILELLAQFKFDWQERFERVGLNQAQLILDPGVGFGKDDSQLMTILQNMGQIQSEENQWLVGHSRKSFISRLWGPSANADQITAQFSAYLAEQGVHYLRVHEPKINLSFIQSTPKEYLCLPLNSMNSRY